MSDKECRIKRFVDVELRASDDNDKRIVDGIACVFDKETDMGWFFEKIDRHAFDDCDMDDVVLNKNHNDDILLARTTNKSLKLEVKDDGLHQKASIIDTTQGIDTYKEVKQGLITKMSFSFVIDRDGGAVWTTDADGKEHRTIMKIKRLFDVSLVSFPAYPQTEVFARNEGLIDELAEEHRKEISMQDKKEKRDGEVIEPATEPDNKSTDAKVDDVKGDDAKKDDAPKTSDGSTDDKKNEPKQEEPIQDDGSKAEEDKEEKSNDVKEKEKRTMDEKNLTLDKTVSTSTVEDRNANEVKEERDSAENLKAFRHAIMTVREDRAGLKSTDAGIPVPTAWFKGVEKAWEKLDIITEATYTEFAGILYQSYEISSTGAVVHTEGSQAPNEEALTLGSIKVLPKMVKKWISLTDELLAMTDEDFIKYVAEEISYMVFKKAQSEMLFGTGYGTNNDEGLVGIVSSSLTISQTETLGFNSVNSALGQLVNAGDNPVVMMNRQTFFNDFMGLTDQNGRPIYQILSDNEGKPRYFLNGIRVKFDEGFDTYGSADAGDVWAIVGNLSKYKINAPKGKDPSILYDPYTKSDEDKERLIGKWFVGGQVISPKAFVKLVKPSASNKDAKAEAKEKK